MNDLTHLVELRSHVRATLPTHLLRPQVGRLHAAAAASWVWHARACVRRAGRLRTSAPRSS